MSGIEFTPGEVLTGTRLTLGLARTRALSGGPWDQPQWPDRNLHTDLGAAQAAGLSEVVVSGTQWEGHLVGFLVKTFGVAWFEGGELEVKLPMSVKVGDSVVPKVRIEAVDRTCTPARVAMQVWCENGSGAEVLVGRASAPLPASAASLRGSAP